MEVIEVVIEHGRATVETRGFKGSACLAATLKLKAALGVVTSEEATREGLEEPLRGREEVRRGR